MRKATHSDMEIINELTNMAKSIMKSDDNPQWDEAFV